MSTCRSCDADVIFVPSAKTGKPMILNAAPEKRAVLVEPSEIESGRSVLTTYPGGVGTHAVVVDAYTDHHVTCPASKDWAGRTRKDPPNRLAGA